MTIDWWTLALQAINFLALAWLLQRFLYRPVLAAIERRRAETEAARAQATEAEARAQAAEAAARAGLERLESDRLTWRRQSEAEAARRGEEVTATARQQAERLLAEARAIIATERQAAARLLADQAAGVAAALAQRLLVQAAPGVGPLPFVDALLARLNSLDPSERAAFTDGPLNLELAPLAGGDAAGRRIAAALGRGDDVPLKENPALIAGARLVSAKAVLEVSWATALAAAQREMANHEHSG